MIIEFDKVSKNGKSARFYKADMEIIAFYSPNKKGILWEVKIPRQNFDFKNSELTKDEILFIEKKSMKVLEK